MRRSIQPRTYVVAALLLGIVGCRGGPAKQLLGSWQPDPAALPASEASDTAALARATLAFRADKSFAIGESVQGKYTIEGRQVTMTTHKILGREATLIAGAETPRIGQLSEDGKRLTVTDPASGVAVDFVKSR